MEIDQILKNKAKDFYYIGERLKKIRKELEENDDTVETKKHSKFSRTNIANALGVDYSTMGNVERGPISVNTIKLIIFYYYLGYNPMWILAPNNDFIDKKNIGGENLVYRTEVQNQYKEMEDNIMLALEVFKKKI
ncbi:hypothetical protein SAMN04489761_3382 [Tenacibaculum sp. MAR_2009_124]|uniref:helix-turn-helix domain-containing protein n=1 Tax=Tenacibaculum sp. MAR_2009_124 TaxID=1250059 RepID=UPI00089498A4|nr:helix-turn-helix transcriptional regulator [Tenacibaculum sp. MAR_2009_124]SEC64493.1 hypothetical protein SAMN04489761_3382 [Tenacibaculum sp. MAR_2009_124]